jgi:Zn-dependent protease with chaperone function
VALGQQAKGLVWLALTVLLAVGAAFGLPRLAGRVPWAVEKGLGRALGGGGGEGCGARRPAAAAALAKVVARLYPLYPEDAGFPLSVRIVPGAEVNAFAGLGGRVAVFDGLVRGAESPEELAGVLAHEIEHVRRRHIIEGLGARLLTFGAIQHVFGGGASIARTLLEMSFGRKQEHEADQGGLERLKRARVSTAGYERFFTRLASEISVPALLSDHPSSDDRAQLVRSYRGGPAEPVLTAAEWESLKTICR